MSRHERSATDPRLIATAPLRWVLESRRATTRLARGIATELEVGDLLILSGDLGSGKTFFTRALCRGLGVPPEIRVTSPTFALVNELTGRLPILHIDLYRVASAAEVVDLGLRERRDSALLVVEWGARWVDALGGEAIELELELDDTFRTATLYGHDGERFGKWSKGDPSGCT